MYQALTHSQTQIKQLSETAVTILGLHSHRVLIVFIRIPDKTKDRLPVSLISLPCQTSKPPSFNLSPSSFFSHTTTAAAAVVNRPPSKPHTISKLLQTIQAARMSSTNCLGRLAFSTLILYQPLHRHCSAAAPAGPRLIRLIW